RDAPLRIELGMAQRDLPRRARVGIFEIDQHTRVPIFALRIESAGAAARPAEAAAAEQRLEEVAELGCVTAGEPAAAEFEASVPIGRGLEVLTLLPVRTELIVRGALLRVLQDFICFADFLEARFGVLLLADVGVILAREFAI